jgi:hypothetical protein
VALRPQTGSCACIQKLPWIAVVPDRVAMVTGPPHAGRLGAHRTGFHLELRSASGKGSGWFRPLKGLLAGTAVEREGNLVGVAAGGGNRNCRKVLVGIQVIGDRALGGCDAPGESIAGSRAFRGRVITSSWLMI